MIITTQLHWLLVSVWTHYSVKACTLLPQGLQMNTACVCVHVRKSVNVRVSVLAAFAHVLVKSSGSVMKHEILCISATRLSFCASY